MSLRRVWLTAVVAVVSVGCVETQKALPATPRETRGVVYLVSGIGGLSPLPPAAKLALPLAGVNHELREFVWQHGKGHHLRDLQDTPNIQEKAEQLAQEIRDLHEREPNRRIYLVGHSAGTAVIAHACELLPPQSIERIIFLSAALSPTYDLTPALHATRGELVSFYSQLDRMVLDWGTNQFGTADRFYGPSAGLSGFVPPKYLDDDGKHCYERLIQVPWTLDKALAFQGGWHHSTTMPWFLARQVAPWLKDPPPKADKKTGVNLSSLSRASFALLHIGTAEVPPQGRYNPRSRLHRRSGRGAPCHPHLLSRSAHCCTLTARAVPLSRT